MTTHATRVPIARAGAPISPARVLRARVGRIARAWLPPPALAAILLGCAATVAALVCWALPLPLARAVLAEPAYTLCRALPPALAGAPGRVAGLWTLGIRLALGALACHALGAALALLRRTRPGESRALRPGALVLAALGVLNTAIVLGLLLLADFQLFWARTCP